MHEHCCIQTLLYHSQIEHCPFSLAESPAAPSRCTVTQSHVCRLGFNIKQRRLDLLNGGTARAVAASGAYVRVEAAASRIPQKPCESSSEAATRQMYNLLAETCSGCPRS
jgi:hypothetical protein